MLSDKSNMVRVYLLCVCVCVSDRVVGQSSAADAVKRSGSKSRRLDTLIPKKEENQLF